MSTKVKVHKDEIGLYLLEGSQVIRPMLTPTLSHLGKETNPYRDTLEEISGHKICWNGIPAL